MRAPRTNFTTKAQAVAEVVRLRRLLAESEQETAALGAVALPLLDALQTLMNVEGAALAATQHLPAYAGLNVPYHFDKARAALQAATEDR